MQFYEYLADLEAKCKVFAIATIVSASENSPGRQSFKMCVTEDGKIVGSIGGGGLEFKARNTALEMMRTGERTRLEEYHLNQTPQGIGMACGGDAQVLIEVIKPHERLFIFGGGHIGSALTRYATDTGFDVTVIDDREDYSKPEVHPMATSTVTCKYKELDTIEFPQNAYFVIVTHQHIGDENCLRALLSRADLNPKYIGLIGSSKKLATVFRHLLDDGFSREQLEFVHAPIGIDHGGQSANEIAISIATEIISVRYGKTLADGMSLKKHPLMVMDNQ
ncbi:MAG: XdhC family protein [Proteobacteria bacterium]|nr:XdhC family protein [Pseudomonadota bacterium]